MFSVDRHGLPAASPVVNPAPGQVPFAVAFDPAGHLEVANAGSNSVTSYVLRDDGRLTALATVATGQQATC